MQLGRRKPHINQPIAQSLEYSQKILKVPKIEKEVINIPGFSTPVQLISNPSMEMINRRMMQKISKDIPFYPNLTHRPPLKQVRIPMLEVPGNIDINPELNTDFKEILHSKKVLYQKHTKDQINHFSSTSRVRMSSKYRKAST